VTGATLVTTLFFESPDVEVHPAFVMFGASVIYYHISMFDRIFGILIKQVFCVVVMLGANVMLKQVVFVVVMFGASVMFKSVVFVDVMFGTRGMFNKSRSSFISSPLWTP